jgi:GntR family transcriptional regulator
MDVRSTEPSGGTQEVRQRLQSSAQPFYISLSNLFRSEIVEGHWPLGTQLPTLDQLSDRYGVAKVTVRQALAVLASERLVERVQGKGTFVAKEIKKPRIVELQSSWRSLVNMLEGSVPELIEMKPECELPSSAKTMGAAIGTYRYMRRVHRSEGEPYGVLDVFLANECYRRAPGAFDSKMIIPVLERVAKLSLAKMTQSLRIISADLTVARFLNLPVNAPIGEVRRVITNKGGGILYLGVCRYRGDLVVFNTTIELPPQRLSVQRRSRRNASKAG